MRNIVRLIEEIIPMNTDDYNICSLDIVCVDR